MINKKMNSVNIKPWFKKKSRIIAISSILGAGVIATVVATPLNLMSANYKVNETVSPNNNPTNQQNSNNSVEWKNVSDFLLFSDDTNLVTPNLQNYVSSNSNNDLNETQIKYVKDKQKEYFHLFKKNNFNLDQINEYLSSKFPDYKKNLQNEIYNLEKSNKLENNLYNSYFSPVLELKTSSNQSQYDLEKRISDLKALKTVFISIAAAAAIAAAGFYIGSIFFPPLFAWATSCTILSAINGGIVAGIDIALVKYDYERSKWENVITSVSAIYELGRIFYSVLSPILVTSAAVITATSWACIAVATALPIIAGILYWISLFK